jgi:chromosome segregation ATPase
MEDTTQNLHDKRPFEERIFARFDAMDARFGVMDARFDAMDARFDAVDGRLGILESRSYDTKPIWERALAAIMETQLEVGNIKTKVDVIEGKVQSLETEVTAIKTDQRTMRDELVDVRRTLRHYVGDRVDMILKFLIEDREDIRDAEARIRELESKLA